MDLPPEIHIITLNCWGLKHLSALREPRLREIAHQLALTAPQPTILCLQEIWAHDDYLALRRTLRPRLPHGKFYHSGAFGGGLAILSAYPIEESTMHPYPLNGRPTAFFRGDWFVGKGIAHARVRLGPAPDDVLEVFNTHTHAAYGADTSYDVHRAAQAWHLAKLLRGAAERGHLVVAAGDLNMTPLSRQHRIITGHAPVRDVWRVLHPDSSLGAANDPAERARRRAVPGAEFNVLENGATSNNVYNTWRWPKAQQRQLDANPMRTVDIPPDCPDPRGKRLDYIFTNTAARELATGPGSDEAVGGWVVSDARVGMMMRHPELGCSLSDHFSVEATLVFHQTTSSTHRIDDTVTLSRGTSLIAGQRWPLPPSSQVDLNQPPMPPLPLSPELSDTNHPHEEGTSQESVQSPAAGAFLSLQSPTASNASQHSLSDGQPRAAAAAAAAVANYDTQLFSSLALPDPSPEIHFSARDYDELLGDIRAYMAREADQTRLRTCHFVFWLVVLVACCIAVWFIPAHNSQLTDGQVHAINFVLLLLSSLGLVAGTLDGLMALLFFRGSEMRALKEFEWEVRNAKALALGETSGVREELGEVKS